jgi:predicted N-acetyltransferase YhbS
MTCQNFTIESEIPAHALEIEEITLEIFGPGMFARAAYKLREGIMPEADLSFVAVGNTKIVGSVRQTRCRVGDNPAILLGPLGVLPDCKGVGIGGALMRRAVQAAKDASSKNDAELVLLVGDLDYYQRFGFQRVPNGHIVMPRPVDCGRILACELNEGALERTRGMAQRWL